MSKIWGVSLFHSTGPLVLDLTSEKVSKKITYTKASTLC